MEKEQNEQTKAKVSQDKKDDNEEILETISETSEAKTENTDELNSDKSKKETPEDKILELEDKLARTFAEMENQRRRFEKEKEEAFEYGGFSFAREALNLIDNLERSKQTLQNDDSLKNSDALKKMLEHFEIINKDLMSIFSKNNIKPVESLNQKLNPNFHQAMLEIEDDSKEPGTIVQEIQKGFVIKDRLLRPALVGVSKKTLNKDKKDNKNIENLEKK